MALGGKRGVVEIVVVCIDEDTHKEVAVEAVCDPSVPWYQSSKVLPW